MRRNNRGPKSPILPRFVGRQTVGISAVIVFFAMWIVWGQAAHATVTGSTSVIFNVAEAIELVSWPSAEYELSDGATPGVPTVSQGLQVVVRSNAEWWLEISSDSPSGFMREYDLASESYVADGHQVGPVEWALTSNGPWEVVSTTPNKMVSKQSPTGSSGQSVDFLLRTTPSYDSPPLKNGRLYRIVLTFTAGLDY